MNIELRQHVLLTYIKRVTALSSYQLKKWRIYIMATKKEEQVKAAMAKVEAAKKAAATKETTEKKAPAKKATTTKTTAKKAPAKKAAVKKTTETVYVQCFGYEITTDDIKAKVAEAVGKKSVKELNIYVKPEEGMIYYTADGEQGSVNL